MLKKVLVGSWVEKIACRHINTINSYSWTTLHTVFLVAVDWRLLRNIDSNHLDENTGSLSEESVWAGEDGGSDRGGQVEEHVCQWCTHLQFFCHCWSVLIYSQFDCIGWWCCLLDVSELTETSSSQCWRSHFPWSTSTQGSLVTGSEYQTTNLLYFMWQQLGK